MHDDAPLIFVCATNREATIDWTAADSRFEVLYTTIPDVALASLHRTHGPGSREVSAVIFDQSIGARGFLHFLSEIECQFRGDVLMVNGDGSATLSTVSVRDGRYVYGLDRDDVRFYAAARFGISSALTPFERDDYDDALTA